MDVTGVALIVGAGSGIGLETALTFAERGARVVIFADKDLQTATAASERSKALAASKEYQTSAVHVDVTDRASVRAMVEEVKAKFGRIDYAVNSAGISPKQDTDLYGVEDDDFDLTQQVNCKGVLYCLQEEIKVMQQQESMYVEGRSGRRSIGPGAIVNVTSLSALIGFPRMFSYTASKFAARGLIKCSALENRGSGLRINEVCPGYTNTPMVKRIFEQNPATEAFVKRSMPWGRLATPEEIAGVIHFLASPAASFINGQSIVADSGVSVTIIQ